MNDTIFSYIREQETAFLKEVEIVEGYFWNFKKHIRRCFLYKSSQFEEKNEDRNLRPFKNIVRGILDVRYRTEGFDVKDIELYVNDPAIYYKSFLIKKFHEDWAPQAKIDTLIDDIVESSSDYGGALVKNTNEARPEVVDLQTIAFCSQHNILARPIGIKHFMSPDELREMGSMGWGTKGATISIEDLIVLTKDNQTKNNGDIEIYEVHGILPEKWLEGDSKKGVKQIQIIAYYKKADGNEQGVTLFKSKNSKEIFKFISPDPIFNRALGWGCIEALFESQVWTNFSEIQMMEMLAAASKILYKSTDPQFKTRNNLAGVLQQEVFTLQEGKDIAQLDTAPRNMVVFENAVRKWQEQAQYIESSNEAVLGQSPSAGTPFKLFEAQQIEGKGTHYYRQGKYAVFVDELYRDWILSHLSKEITKDSTFLTTLSSDEFQTIADTIVSNRVEKMKVERILNGELIYNDEVEQFKTETRESFLKGGSKRFLKILKDEFKDVPIKVKTNIIGKGKNLALVTDKVVNILRQFIATPEIRQDPEMVKLLNIILESSGLSPLIFGSSRPSQPSQPAQMIQPQNGSTEPLKALAEAKPLMV